MEAKGELEKCDGNVVNALIYLEEKEKTQVDGMFTSKEEIITWIKKMLNCGQRAPAEDLKKLEHQI